MLFSVRAGDKVGCIGIHHRALSVVIFKDYPFLGLRIDGHGFATRSCYPLDFSSAGFALAHDGLFSSSRIAICPVMMAAWFFRTITSAFSLA